MSNHRASISSHPQTILVVDNLEEMRGAIGGWLVRHGYRVAEAEDGRGAVEQARRLAPDLILMDLKMPGMDGVEAARAIKSDAALCGVPIVAVSADNTEYYRAAAREAGFSDYLVKPFEAGELEGVLDRLLPKAGGTVH